MLESSLNAQSFCFLSAQAMLWRKIRYSLKIQPQVSSPKLVDYKKKKRVINEISAL
jgi:hypothetical protein